ncbi:MAG: biopolymer transporter ExbD [Parasulfuritortus sp.]|nr:biopolymer transporter ExbD [Parasulfuritortus sp.]
MERSIEEINVIPLVDVMLVLLVIVLTTASFITAGQIPVNLAKAKNAEASQQTPIQITLSADGSIYLNQQKTTVQGLAAIMKPLPRQAQVIVVADKGLVLDRFVGVVDAIKGLGFERISLKVERV